MCCGGRSEIVWRFEDIVKGKWLENNQREWFDACEFQVSHMHVGMYFTWSFPHNLCIFCKHSYIIFMRPTLFMGNKSSSDGDYMVSKRGKWMSHCVHVSDHERNAASSIYWPQCRELCFPLCGLQWLICLGHHITELWSLRWGIQTEDCLNKWSSSWTNGKRHV